MIIYGAGMAGLIAATMLRRFKPVVKEAKGQLPNLHKAVLRFRTDAVARATGIPFRCHKVQKAAKWSGELTRDVTLQMANAYSFKVSGAILNRSINRMEDEDRWIAPPDFVRVLAESANIQFNAALHDLPEKLPEPAISTIHLPLMVRNILELKDTPEFKWNNILVARAEVDCRSEVYQTIYYPDPGVPYYRASMEGRTLILEMREDDPILKADSPAINGWMRAVLVDFGIYSGTFERLPEVSLQPFGKILPIDEKWRRDFIFELTRKKNVYSLGRFATWRQILLDDVVKDVEQIERMISSGDNYGRRLAS